jgi:hypothetical protein
VFDNNQRIQIEEKERNYTERRTINDWHDAPMVSVGSLATKTLAFAKIRPLCGDLRVDVLPFHHGHASSRRSAASRDPARFQMAEKLPSTDNSTGVG